MIPVRKGINVWTSRDELRHSSTPFPQTQNFDNYFHRHNPFITLIVPDGVARFPAHDSADIEYQVICTWIPLIVIQLERLYVSHISRCKMKIWSPERVHNNIEGPRVRKQAGLDYIRIGG